MYHDLLFSHMVPSRLHSRSFSSTTVLLHRQSVLLCILAVDHLRGLVAATAHQRHVLAAVHCLITALIYALTIRFA